MKVRLCFAAQGRRADGCSKVTLPTAWQGYIECVAVVAQEVLGLESCSEACLRMSYYDVDGAKCNITRPTYQAFLDDVEQLNSMAAEAGVSPTRYRERPPGEVHVVYTGDRRVPQGLPQLVPTNPVKRRKQRPTTGHSRRSPGWDDYGGASPRTYTSDTAGRPRHHPGPGLPPHDAKFLVPADHVWYRQTDSSTTTMGYSSPATPPKPSIDDMAYLPLLAPGVIEQLDTECEAAFKELMSQEREEWKLIVLGTVINSLLLDLLNAEQRYRESIEADSRIALQQLSFRKVTARPASGSVGFRRSQLAKASTASRDGLQPLTPNAPDAPHKQQHRRVSKGGAKPVGPDASKAARWSAASSESSQQPLPRPPSSPRRRSSTKVKKEEDPHLVAVPSLPPPMAATDVAVSQQLHVRLAHLADDEQIGRRSVVAAYASSLTTIESVQSKLWIQAALAQTRDELEREQEPHTSGPPRGWCTDISPQRPAADRTPMQCGARRGRLVDSDEALPGDPADSKCSESQGLSSLASEATNDATTLPGDTPKGASRKPRSPASPSGRVTAARPSPSPQAAQAATPPALKKRQVETPASSGGIENWPVASPSPALEAIPIMPMVQAALPFLFWPLLSALPNLTDAAPELRRPSVEPSPDPVAPPSL
eukprot:TRINITY_DN7175_c0_g3_i1.p1 TRINITY_DN7175_c0_g3~~TRINITY_DN7175_c0_g3_i1.p1  ORF type:complete len:653 (+),score=133.96 TRINITY_DN7175_c0_g3_i1:160-2118(+)